MKLIAIIISWLTIVGCQAKSDGFIIKGELEGAPENEWIFLTDAKQRVYYDSVQIKKGRFEFRGKLDSPELRNIVFYKDPAQRVYGWANILRFPVYLDNSEVHIAIPFAEMPSKLDKKTPASLRVEGSATHDLFATYIQQVEPLNLKYEEVFDRYCQVYYRKKGSEEDMVKCVKEMDAIRDSIYYRGVDFIREHGDSPVALYVVGNLAVERYGRADARKILEFFPPQVRASEAGKQVEDVLAGKPLYINDAMPDFTVLDVDLQERKLSEYVKKGRYTLVEFWASWCGPCRHDIPHLKETYKRFHDKGFDIVSVSIDDDTAKWQKALKEERMAWTQVCGAKGQKFDKECVQMFGVSGVPSGFLIDPDGKVVHMTARGGWLDTKLMELFGR